VFRAELALLRVEPAFRGLRSRIIEIASLLEGVSNVPMVAAEMALIQEVQTEDFWQDITVPMVETVRRRLRSLVKLIEHKKRPPVYSDFEDSIGAHTEIEVPGISVGTDLDAFRRKARLFLKPHENHIAVLKLKRNEPLTPTDLADSNVSSSRRASTNDRSPLFGPMLEFPGSSARWSVSIGKRPKRHSPDSWMVVR
jgi:type I restriction enzyme R subunit